MRKRLEERDAVNEELRNELGRERVRRSIDSPVEQDRFPAYLEHEPQAAELAELGGAPDEENPPVPVRQR